MRVERGERPDFVIRCSLGTVGVEVTQAVPAGLAKIRDIERRESIDRPRAYRQFKPGGGISAAEAKRSARSHDRNFSLPGEATIMTNWIEAMLWRIDRKQEGFTYTPHDRNVLLIDDQWPAHELPEDAAFAHLEECLRDRSETFDDIFVDRERSKNMLGFGRLHGIYRIPVELLQKRA